MAQENTRLTRIEDKLDNMSSLLMQTMTRMEDYPQVKQDVNNLKDWRQNTEGRVWGIVTTAGSFGGIIGFVGSWIADHAPKLFS